MFFERFFTLDHNKERSFDDVIFLFSFVISRSSLVESRKFTHAFFKNSMLNKSKKFNVMIDSWIWILNKCSWIYFFDKFIFFEILRCWTRFKNWSWFILFCRSTTRLDWFKITWDFCIIVMNNIWLSHENKTLNHSFRVEFFLVLHVSFFFQSTLPKAMSIESLVSILKRWIDCCAHFEM